MVQSNTSRSLFKFHGHSTQEPASIIWNSKQVDLFYSAGPHRHWVILKLRTGFRQNAGGWTGSVEISSRKKSLAVGEACMAFFWPTPGLKGRTFEFWALNKWVFNCCIHSTLLWENNQRSVSVNPLMQLLKHHAFLKHKNQDWYLFLTECISVYH